VMVSETTLSSSRVRVTSPNATSTMLAVHMGFGHEPAGASGSSVPRLNRNEPFLGVASGPVVPVASKSNS
jgi:hypothetical protein